MRSTSIVVLVAAVIFGLVAVAGVRGVLNARNASPDAGMALSTVVVASKPMEFGTELTATALTTVKWPVEARPEGAFSTVEEVVGGDRRVALRSIAEGEPVLKDKISGFGGRASLSQVIEEGHRAIAVRITDVSGAGGFILPADRVDVVMTISPTNDRLDTVSTILLENIRVLAIDQEADDSKGGAIVAKAATLEVTPEEAQKIALASTIGALSLSLRNTVTTEDNAAAASKPIRYKDLGPAPPERKAAAPRPAAPAPYAVMKVTRGVESTSASVPRETAATRPSSSLGPAGAAMTTSAADAVGTVATSLKLGAPAGDSP